MEYAAENALEHHLGLTCEPHLRPSADPLASERNAVAAKRAMTAFNLPAADGYTEYQL